MVSKQKLIEEASEILGSIYKKDIFGIGNNEPCLESTELKRLVKWHEDLRVFALNLNNQAIERELNSIWFYNGERVSEDGIRYAIKLLNQIED